jgi:hypothetical protein
MKRIILAVISIFVLWAIIDFIIHGIILSGAYQSTAQLWRPMEEMKTGLMYVTVLISAIVFVLIYQRFFAKKGLISAIQYGLLFGIGAGISFGYGSYSVMPIPYIMAFTWFFGTLIKTTLAGLLLSMVIKE